MAAQKELVVSEGSGKKKIFIIGGAAALVIILGIVAWLFFAGPSSDSSEDADALNSGAGANAEAIKGDAVYVPMPRPFVFNLAGAARDRLVQIKVQLLVRGVNNETLALRHIPLIEGSLLKTFSAANADVLAGATGRDALKNKALSDLQQAMIEVVGSVVVEEVLFTGFVMQ